MKSEAEAVLLLVLLFIATVALGVTFGGAGLSGVGGTGNGATATATPTTTPTSPEFVVIAQGVNPAYLYESSYFGTVPQWMLVPLVGLHLFLVLPGRSSGSGFGFGRAPALRLTTNSSGMASVSVEPGDYELTITGSDFTFTASLALTYNTTATLHFELQPSAVSVTTLSLVSQDSMSGVEPTAKLYALLNQTSPPTPGFSELVGIGGQPFNGTVITNLPTSLVVDNATGGQAVFLNGTVIFSTQSGLNATLIGSYPGVGGYWAVMAPVGPSPALPTTAVKLFQFNPVYEVNYTAG